MNEHSGWGTPQPQPQPQPQPHSEWGQAQPAAAPTQVPPMLPVDSTLKLIQAVLGPELFVDTLVEASRTDNSTIYRAPGVNMEVEVFSPTGPEDANRAERLAGFSHPGAVGIYKAGLSGDNRLIIAREAAGTHSLQTLLEQRAPWGNAQFSAADARRFLHPAAQAVDRLVALGLEDWAVRGLSTNALQVRTFHDGSQYATIASIGPAPQPVQASPAQLLAEVYSALTSTPIRPELLDRGAEGYLDAVAQLPSQQPTQRPPQQPPFDPINETLKEPLPEPTLEPPPQPNPRAAGSSRSGVKRASAKRVSISKNVLSTVLVLMVLAGIATGGWFMYTRFGESWNASEQAMSQAFPGLISKRPNGSGWNGLKCVSQEVDPTSGTYAHVRCASSELGVSVMDHGDPESAAAYAANFLTAEGVAIGNQTCTVTSFEMTNQSPPAFIILPSESKGRYTITINGNNAEQERLTLPLCAQ